MIIKNRGSFENDIAQLKELLSLRLTDKQRFLLEREIRFLRSGEKGEKDSAYYIDYYLGRSKNWAVIHDLRLSFFGQTAQIDHVLMNRFLEVYVLETKNYAYSVKINPDGEFLVSHDGKYYSIESPIEQNERHIFLLKKAIDHYQIMPTRLGIPIPPSFNTLILVSPTSRVIRPAKNQFDTSRVIKSDLAIDTIMKEIDKNVGILGITKMISTETLVETATKLSQLHQPISFNYKAKFGITETTKLRDQKSLIVSQDKTSEKSERTYYCIKCRKPISQKVAQYCWDRKNIFGGRAYCFDCQKEVSKATS
ncbi:MAG: nuclease-related domain-containing protein [Syntrophorhabdaceae bacterium]|nr:nuclease-related domain-containing protein [Syntrophorhabdaceae bacterium]